MTYIISNWPVEINNGKVYWKGTDYPSARVGRNNCKALRRM